MNLLEREQDFRKAQAYYYLAKSLGEASRKNMEKGDYKAACKLLFLKTNNLFKARLTELHQKVGVRNLSQPAEFIRMADLLYPVGYEWDILEVLSYEKPTYNSLDDKDLDIYCVQYMRSLASVVNLEKNLKQPLLYGGR